MEIKKYQNSPNEKDDITRICRDFSYFPAYQEFFSDQYYQVILASIEGNNVGVGVCSRHGFVLSGDFLWLDEDFRNLGIGTKLLYHMLDMAKQRGLRALIGDTLETDLGAIRLYERIGGENIGQYENLYGDGKQIMFRVKIPENMK